MAPGCEAAESASSRMRRLYSPVKDRRLASALDWRSVCPVKFTARHAKLGVSGLDVKGATPSNVRAETAFWEPWRCIGWIVGDSEKKGVCKIRTRSFAQAEVRLSDIAAGASAV